jgi:hypothetical protein
MLSAAILDRINAELKDNYLLVKINRACRTGAGSRGTGPNNVHSDT